MSIWCNPSNSNRLLPNLADLQAESSALDEQIKSLEDDDDDIEPFTEPEGLWMTPEDLKTSTSSLVAQAKEAESQINMLRTSLDGLTVGRSSAPHDPVKVPDQAIQSLAAAGSVLKKLDELEKAMKKLPLDDRKWSIFIQCLLHEYYTELTDLIDRDLLTFGCYWRNFIVLGGTKWN